MGHRIAGLQWPFPRVADHTGGCEITLPTDPDHLSASNSVFVANVDGPVPTALGPSMGLLQLRGSIIDGLI